MAFTFTAAVSFITAITILIFGLMLFPIIRSRINLIIAIAAIVLIIRALRSK
jgi:hypothetical protein